MSWFYSIFGVNTRRGRGTGYTAPAPAGWWSSSTPQAVRRSDRGRGGAGAAVEGGALLQAAAQGLDDRPEGGLLHQLAVGGSGGAADVLVHQRAAEVVDPGQQGLADPVGAHLDPRHLDVVDQAVVGDPSHCMDQQGLAEGRPGP